MKLPRPLRNLLMALLTLFILFPLTLLLNFMLIQFITAQWYLQIVQNVPSAKLIAVSLLALIVSGALGWLFTIPLDFLGKRWTYPLGILCAALSGLASYFIVTRLTYSVWTTGALFALFFAYIGVECMLSANRTDAQLTDPRRLLLAAFGYVAFFIVGFFLPEMQSGAKPFFEPAAILYFIVLVLVLNNSSVRRSAVARRADGAARVPRSIRRNNLFLTAVFLLIAAAVTVMDFLGRGLIELLFSLRDWLSALWKSFLALFAEGQSSSGSVTALPVPTPTPEIVGEFDTKGDFFSKKFIILCLLVGAALLALFLFFHYLPLLKKLWAALRRWFASWRSGGGEEGDYTDDEEDLLAARPRKKLFDRMREGIQALFERQRFSDMPDNRMRVRFAYREALRKAREEDPSAPARTPTEQMDAIKPRKNFPRQDYQSFAKDYNAARYSEHPVSDEAAERARALLRKGI